MATAAPQPDVAFLLAQALLGRFVQRLTDAGVAPAKAFISDGASVPADECCDGLAWVRVGQIQPTDGSSNPYSEMRNTPIPTPGHSIVLEVGVLRCAPVLDEQGNAPSADEYTEAALAAAFDRQSLRMAVLCDFVDDINAVNADGQIPGPWTPLDAGGCAGGYMTTSVGTSMII